MVRLFLLLLLVSCSIKPTKNSIGMDNGDYFNKLLNEEENWSFVNKLDNSKLKQLFDEFIK